MNAPAKIADSAALKPPAPLAPRVLAYRKKLERDRDALRLGDADIALLAALGDTAAKAAIAAVPGQIASLEYEISLNHRAYELAEKRDSAADAAWRASLRTLPPELVLAGLGKECCPGLCRPGTPAGCVIGGSHPHAGGTCCHPEREMTAVYGRDQNGNRQFRYRDDPRANEVFEAARTALKVD